MSWRPMQPASVRRLAIATWGTVQGVGFRPFVYAAATSRGLSGWVRNGRDAVRLEVQGPDEALEDFLSAIRSPPAMARVERLEAVEVPVQACTGFSILESDTKGRVHPTLPADQAICSECAAEMDDPAERRHGYPFTNCAQCGPRYSIVVALPYDRARTSMKDFTLCRDCSTEYSDPSNRRFHAQPIACPACGPQLRLLSPSDEQLAMGADALEQFSKAILKGQVLALQGLGGFHLLVDATDVTAVDKLRASKHREHKPFAVMFPSLASLRRSCVLSTAEEEALCSSVAPIVLARRRAGDDVAFNVAPGNPRLGVMLPYTPLHRLLLSAVARPLVCTSGNHSDEPICIDASSARERLGDIAELFLVHDRPIVRPVDDSIARVESDGLHVLRRARGLAPLPHRLATGVGGNVLATGAQLKSTVALFKERQVVVSQHLGDLSSAESAALLERTARELVCLFDAEPDVVACDLHPDYASSRLAERLAAEWSVPLVRVQHHHAHIAACVAEHRITDPVLGLAWDGAGLGSDGTIWGGEALLVTGASFRRVAHLRPFSLPGGESAMREPNRSALGVLHELFGRSACEYVDVESSRARALCSMLDAGVNSPRTSSMGRLFDAVAALVGIGARVSYQGQAAMELEYAAEGVDDPKAYPLPLSEKEPAVADWEPLLRALLVDRARHTPVGTISARFHNSLAGLAEAIAERVGVPRVVLSGGCFQNPRLVEAVRERLRARGFAVFTPRAYPPNDGGVSLGQGYVAALRRRAC